MRSEPIKHHTQTDVKEATTHIGNGSCKGRQIVSIRAILGFETIVQRLHESEIKDFDISADVKTNVFGFDLSPDNREGKHCVSGERDPCSFGGKVLHFNIMLTSR